MHPSLSVAAEADWLAAQGRAPAAKSPGTPERDFQVEQVAYLRGALPPGAVLFAVTNEHAARAKSPGARARFHAKRRAQGVAPGFPDIGIALADARVVWVENKSPRGVLSDAQRDMHAALRALGHSVIVARDIEGTRAGLIAAGVALSEGAAEPVREAKVRTVRARIRGSTFRLPVDKLPFGGRDHE